MFLFPWVRLLFSFFFFNSLGVMRDLTSIQESGELIKMVAPTPEKQGLFIQ